jgi:hypothetical protein
MRRAARRDFSSLVREKTGVYTVPAVRSMKWRLLVSTIFLAVGRFYLALLGS